MGSSTLVEGKQLSVDGSFVGANAAKKSHIPREQLAEATSCGTTTSLQMAKPHGITWRLIAI
jgi:hypothetical protein